MNEFVVCTINIWNLFPMAAMFSNEGRSSLRDSYTNLIKNNVILMSNHNGHFGEMY